ncbi:MAG: DUF4405 domain-containing protein [Kiritimatiellia bacterium]
MRKITSLILLFGGVIELITAVVLYIIPASRVAYWGDYHITVGFLLVAASLLHIFFNLKPILRYLSDKANKFVFFSNFTT